MPTKAGLLLLVLLVPFLQSNEESATGTLQINMRSTSGEMADYHGVVLKIYSDGDQIPQEIQPTSNPFDVSLPLNHRYKVEVFASSMYCDVDFVEMTQSNQRVELSIPIPGSVRLTTLYSDANVPLSGAVVFLHSSDGVYQYWTNSTTDPDGNTMRYWLQPTSAENYYVADIYLDDNISYRFSPITVYPGVSQDIKIVTPWPKVIDQLITVSVFGPNSERISGLKNNLVVEAYDDDGQKIATSKITHTGDAYFSSLEVGNYLFRVVDLDHDNNLGDAKIMLTGKTPAIQIFTAPKSENKSAIQTPDIIPETSSPIQATNSSLSADPIKSQEIPAWIRNVADWWSNGQISDAEFLKAVEYLVNNNIISIQHLQSG